MGTRYPILPVDGKAALQLFNQLAGKGLADEQREMEMCLEWCKHVDGIEIFPTAPSYLRQHVKKWQRSNHVRDHIRKAKHKLEELRAVNATTLNTFLSARNGSVAEATEQNPLAAAARGTLRVGQRSSLSEFTPPGARRGNTMSCVGLDSEDEVCAIAVAELQSPPNGTASRRRGRGSAATAPARRKRGADRRQRRRRHCQRCLECGASNEEARECPGNRGADLCVFRDLQRMTTNLSGSN